MVSLRSPTQGQKWGGRSQTPRGTVGNPSRGSTYAKGRSETSKWSPLGMCSLSTAALPRGCLLHTDTGLQWRQWWGRSYWLLSARLREGIAPTLLLVPWSAQNTTWSWATTDVWGRDGRICRAWGRWDGRAWVGWVLDISNKECGTHFLRSILPSFLPFFLPRKSSNFYFPQLFWSIIDKLLYTCVYVCAW